MLFFVFAIFVVCEASSSSHIEVEIKTGRVQGTLSNTDKGTEYYAFEGIPYAEPPVGELRFKAPVPIKPWTGVYKPETPANDRKCLQNWFGHLEGSEDCLYLHVFTPRKATEVKAPLSVMVYIHGGAFIGGAGGKQFTGHPDNFIDRDVILVGINYRVGPFGFLSTEDAEVPGNFGMLDQVAALQWIKDNIAGFGGNPDDVTIFGMSAGGASVHYLILSPMAKGLFQKAISESGSSLNPWARTKVSLMRAKRLGEKLGCPQEPNEELIECLRQKEGAEVMEASLPDDHEKWALYPFTWAPRVDSEAAIPFLPKPPMEIMTSGDYSRVPYITGFNRDEGLWCYPPTPFFNDASVKAMYHDWGRVCKQLLNTIEFNITEEEFQDMCEKTIEHYIEKDKLEDVYDIRYIQLVGDTQFNAGTMKTARIMSKFQPVYVYTMDFFSKKINLMLRFNKGHEKVLRGVHHADEVMYLFDFKIPEIKESPEKEMTEIMSTVWTNFAKTGVPTFPDSSIRWETTSDTERKYMSLNLKPEMKVNYRQKDMDFWNEMFKNMWYKTSTQDKDEL